MLGSEWFLADLNLNYTISRYGSTDLLVLSTGLQCYATRISLMLPLNLVREKSYKLLGHLEL